MVYIELIEDVEMLPDSLDGIEKYVSDLEGGKVGLPAGTIMQWESDEGDYVIATQIIRHKRTFEYDDDTTDTIEYAERGVCTAIYHNQYKVHNMGQRIRDGIDSIVYIFGAEMMHGGDEFLTPEPGEIGAADYRKRVREALQYLELGPEK